MPSRHCSGRDARPRGPRRTNSRPRAHADFRPRDAGSLFPVGGLTAPECPWVGVDDKNDLASAGQAEGDGTLAQGILASWRTRWLFDHLAQGWTDDVQISGARPDVKKLTLEGVSAITTSPISHAGQSLGGGRHGGRSPRRPASGWAACPESGRRGGSGVDGFVTASSPKLPMPDRLEQRGGPRRPARLRSVERMALAASRSRFHPFGSSSGLKLGSLQLFLGWGPGAERPLDRAGMGPSPEAIGDDLDEIRLAVPMDRLSR